MQQTHTERLMNGSTAICEPTVANDLNGRWWGLAVLMAMGLYTYSDRYLIGLQADAIRQQLQLSNFQLGLLQGLSVAIFLVVAGYPIGWMADRFDKRHVLAFCALGWATAIAASGLAQDFPQLFAATAFVGVAKAGLVPIAFALIPEWFGARNRQVANSTFVLVARLAVGLLIAACGWAIASVDALRSVLPPLIRELPTWRLSMLLVGVLALPLVPAILSMPAKPRNHRTATMPIVGVAKFLHANWATYGTLFAAVGLMALGANAMAGFVAVVVTRQWGATPTHIGNSLGAAALLAAIGALCISTVGARWLSRRHATTAGLRLAGASLAVAAITAPLLLLADSVAGFFALYGLNLVGIMTCGMVFPSAIQALSPVAMRARIMSIFVTATTLLGASGPAIVGAVADWFESGIPALLTTMIATEITALSLSLVMTILCLRTYENSLTQINTLPTAA